MKYFFSKKAILTAYPVFQDRDYRVYFFGQLISYSGNWLQNVALGWLVLQMTGSAIWVGVVFGIPYFAGGLFVPLGGAIADKFDQKKVLYLTNVSGVIQAGALGLMVLTHHANLFLIVFLAFFYGLINAVDSPTRVTFATEIVEPQYVGVVAAMNGALQTAAQLIGPGLGGFLIALVGSGWTFLINAATFLPVIISLLIIGRVHHAKIQTEHPLRMFWSGAKYTFRESRIFACVLIAGLVAVFGYSFIAILPVATADIFKAGPKVLGYLGSSAGLGACLGALIIAAKSKKKLPLELYILGGILMTGVSLFLLSFTNALLVGMLLLFFAGMGFTLSLATARAESQVISERNMRGRVAGITIMAFFGGMALGNYLIGLTAEKFGVHSAFRFFSLALFLLSVFTYFMLKYIEQREITPA